MMLISDWSISEVQAPPIAPSLAGLSAYNLKCVLMRFKTLKNDFQHYHKSLSENFFGTDCPRTIFDKCLNVFQNTLGDSRMIFSSIPSRDKVISCINYLYLYFQLHHICPSVTGAN